MTRPGRPPSPGLTATALSRPALEAARARTLRTLVAGVALGSTGHIAAATVSAIAAEELLGDPLLAGSPGAAVVLGAAGGTLALSAIMLRRGRRPGLATGYLVSAVGGLFAAASIMRQDFWLLLVGMLLIGFGNSSNQLSRYAAADVAPASRRPWSISIVVWATTIGAILGPTLVPLAHDAAVRVGLPGLAGPFLLPVVFTIGAATLTFTFLRPDPYELADTSEDHPDGAAATGAGAAPGPGAVAAPEAAAGSETTLEAGAAGGPTLGTILRRPAVMAALVALVVGQFVMVLIMTMTPVHMTGHGHGLGSVGLVITGHTAGMYALSPLSGRLGQRLGPLPTVLLGSTVLAVSAIMAALAPADGGVVLFASLFLLGFGWNLGYVAGSALLSSGLDLAERTRVQGGTDALIWSTSAVASLSSGVILAAAGFTALGILSLGLVAVGALFVISRRHALARPATRSA